MTTEIELKGIRIAEITGESKPCIAKVKPMRLYNNDITKLILMTFIAFFERFKKEPN